MVMQISRRRISVRLKISHQATSRVASGRKDHWHRLGDHCQCAADERCTVTRRLRRSGAAVLPRRDSVNTEAATRAAERLASADGTDRNPVAPTFGSVAHLVYHDLIGFSHGDEAAVYDNAADNRAACTISG